MKFAGPLTSGIAGRHCILIDSSIENTIQFTNKKKYTGASLRLEQFR